MSSGYRSSPVGRIPAGWRVARLGHLCRGPARYGASAPAEPLDAHAPRYIRITDISELGRLRATSPVSLSAGRARRHRLAEGDLLIARSGATAGKSYLYRASDGPCAFASYLICFSLDAQRCDPEYVAYLTHTQYYRAWLTVTVRQAAQANINAHELAELRVPVPPVAEQRRIARVLAAQDRVIEASRRVIEKLQRIKLGLLHEALSRGIDDAGCLGPDRHRKRSPIGPIPRHWVVRPIEALLRDRDGAMRSGPFGSQLLKSELGDHGVPILGIDNVAVEALIPHYTRFVPHHKAAELDRYRVHPGDVLVTIMGSVGRACVVPDDIGQALSSKHLWAMTFDPSRYLPRLASLQINHAGWVREHFRREEQGGTMVAIRSDTLRTTLLPVPPLHEQHRIVGLMNAHDDRVRSEQATLAKRMRIREALIEELVFGKVRVTGDLDDALESGR